MTNVIFDIHLFFVFLAESIIEFPNIRKNFKSYYETDKCRFYEYMLQSPQYNRNNMSWRDLESEIAMRRIFGILLCAEEDEYAHGFVYEELTKFNKRFNELVLNPNKADLDAFIRNLLDEMSSLPGSYDAKNAPMFFLAYLFYTTYGTNCENKVVNDYLSHTYKMILCMNKNKDIFRNMLNQGFKMNGIAIPKKPQALIKHLRTGFDLASFLDFHSADKRDTVSHKSNPQLFSHIKDYYHSGNEESRDFLSSIAIINIAAHVSAINGIDITGLSGAGGITKTEQNAIIKCLADLNPGANAVEMRRQICVTNYVIGHIFMLLSKEIQSMKAFYFENNSETQYLELQCLTSSVEEKGTEIERLRCELLKANEINMQQKDEIMMLTDELHKETKDAIKPYICEISVLNGRIKGLEKGLEMEESKNPELNVLREFAFAVQSEYVPPETTITLAELVQGKKVIIVGGHISWRNKMKQQYSAITYIDGHNVSLDVSSFDNADFILLNTANMSHKLYYKMIGHLRDKKLRFDYLGRSKNHDLLEAEIVAILKEKM